jgi:hypothetical protein
VLHCIRQATLLKLFAIILFLSIFIENMPFKSNSLSDKDIKDILKSQGTKIEGIYMKDQLPTTF